MGRRLYGIVLPVFILFIITGCQDVKEDEMMSSVVYSYADGSGNHYVFEGGERYTFEYDPVKPAESSSGYYDGGDYVKKEISQAEYERIAAIFSRAFAEKESHIENRVMLSGLFIIKEGSEVRRCIHAPDSALKAEFEELLKGLRSTSSAQ